jgi:hypothetical protein
VCGFHTRVKAFSADGINVALLVESDCPRVRAMAAELGTLDALDEVLRRPFVETTPGRLSAVHKLHATCLAPVGLLKAVEAVAGLALPARSEIDLTRDE